MNSEDKMLKFKKFSESVELDEEASNLHTMYSDISESDGDRYGVFSKGGSIGQNSSKPPVKVFSNADEAKAYAKRMRATLSPGERNDYGMSYIVKKVNESVDEASSTSPNMAKAVQGLNDLGYKLKGRDGKDVQRVEKLFRSGNKKVLQGAIRALDTDIRDQIMDILEPLGFVKDGVVEEVTISIDESVNEALKAGKGKGLADIDYVGDKQLTQKIEKMFKIKIKQTGNTTADVTGEKKDILNFLMKHYYYDDSDVMELYPEIVEDKDLEEFGGRSMSAADKANLRRSIADNRKK